MATQRFLHVGFTPQYGKEDELREVFDANATDWLRYAPNCWIVYTDLSVDAWADKMKPHLGEKALLFVCKLDLSERQGLFHKWAWEWLDKER
jgi:hypothetical protein